MSKARDSANQSANAGKPWGPWATIGFGFLIATVWVIVQSIAFVALAGARLESSEVAAEGWMVAWLTVISAPVLIGASLLLASVRKGIRVAAYLGLAWPSASQAIRASLILVGLILAFDLLSLALGRAVVPEPMISMYQTAGSWPIFLIGFVVAAPLAEEFFFRGFLFPGLVESRLGLSGAIALTALAWSSLHVQYDLYGIASVAVLGVFLGFVRWRTRSLWLCVLLHCLTNAIATLEVFIVLRG